ncbi:MAG: hypothetical protein ABI200_05020 [Gaiellales bacterium]
MSRLLARVPAASSTLDQAYAPPPPTKGVGKDRALLDGVTLDRPFGAVSTIITNAIEHLTGYRDERLGAGTQQVLLAGTQLVQATLRHAAQGKGIVAESSSVLGKILPVAGIVSGIAQVWQGWHELDHPTSPLDILGSRTARTGLLSIAASSMLFIPGVGSALGGALMRIAAGANELDLFHSLDLPSHSLEQGPGAVAAKAHPFDRTPTNPYDKDVDKRHQGAPAPNLAQYGGGSVPIGTAAPATWVG